jgi:hypothetical protein
MFAGSAFLEPCAPRLFIATAVDTTVLALLSRIALYCPLQNGVRGSKAVAARRILTPFAGDLGGSTRMPGSYAAGAAITLAGILWLDAGDVKDAVWQFTISGAFTTAAASEINIINGGGTVKWVVTGAITTGAGSHAIGEMIASGAITVGASAIVGDLHAGGAITLGAGATSGTVNAGGAITMGAGATSIGGATATGAVSLGVGASAGTFIPADMGGRTFQPGNYTAATAVGLTGEVTLDNAIDNGEWIFEIAAALTTAAGSKMVVTGGATYTVTWRVTGAITTGANSEAIGTMKTTAGAMTMGAGATAESLDAFGAITLGAGANVTGDVLSGGAITFGAGASAGGTVTATGAVTLAVGASAAGYLPVDLGGLTLTAPANYTTTGANTLTGILTLAGPGNFEFHIGGAFSAAAAAKIVITNNADVIFTANGAIALGAGATSDMNMTATGAITLGAGATSKDLIAGGSISLGAGAHAASSKQLGALTLGAGAGIP